MRCLCRTLFSNCLLHFLYFLFPSPCSILLDSSFLFQTLWQGPQGGHLCVSLSLGLQLFLQLLSFNFLLTYVLALASSSRKLAGRGSLQDNFVKPDKGERRMRSLCWFCSSIKELVECLRSWLEPLRRFSAPVICKGSALIYVASSYAQVRYLDIKMQYQNIISRV